MSSLLEAMVMEAEAARKNQPPKGGNVISDAPQKDEEAPIDYGGGMPDPDTPDQGNQGSQPAGGANPPPDQGGGDDASGGNDYGADIPDPDEGQGDAQQGGQDNPPADDAAGQGQDDQGGGNDYGADMPDPDAPDQGDGGGQDAAGGGKPNAQGDPTVGGDVGTDPNADPNAQGADDQDPNADPNAQGQDGQGADQVDPQSADAAPDQQPEGLTPAEQTADSILLLRNYIKLHREIRNIITKIQESKRESMLASVVYDQVVQNLSTLKDMVHKYIILIFDNTPYEENLFNFNYTIEVVHWNIDMIKKVQRATEKAKIAKDKKLKKKAKRIEK